MLMNRTGQQEVCSTFACVPCRGQKRRCTGAHPNVRACSGAPAAYLHLPRVLGSWYSSGTAAWGEGR